jgi:hypothetical protein
MPIKQLKDGLKECSKCKVYKVLDAYHKRKNKLTGEYYPNGSSACKECVSNITANWVYKNKDYNVNRNKIYRLEKRTKVIEHYGGKCECCGESNYEFMSIDHINGGGTKHREELGNKGRGHNFYSWLIQNNYPDDFRVMCHNCNTALGLYGYCPHQKGEMAFGELYLDGIKRRGNASIIKANKNVQI